jgi:hypothetical protein
VTRKTFTNAARFIIALILNPRVVFESFKCGAGVTSRLLFTTYRVYMLMRDDDMREAAEAELAARASAPDPKPQAWPLEHSPMMLVNVHDTARCAGKPCPVHSRTDHALRSWPQFFRADAGFMERTCRHGVGHPDPDCQLAPPVHGCDGCCVAGDAAELGAEHLPEAS